MRVPGDVAHREGHQRAVLALHVVGDDRVEDSGDQAAVGEHRPLRPARRPARVQLPGDVVLLRAGQLRRRIGGGEQVVVVDDAVASAGRPTDHDDVLDGRELLAHVEHLLQEGVLDEQDRRPRVVDDPRQLVRVEPVVEEHQRHPRRRHAVVGVDVLHRVLAEDRHPVARCAELRDRCGEPPGALVQLAKVKSPASVTSASRPGSLTTFSSRMSPISIAIPSP